MAKKESYYILPLRLGFRKFLGRSLHSWRKNENLTPANMAHGHFGGWWLYFSLLFFFQHYSLCLEMNRAFDSERIKKKKKSVEIFIERPKYNFSIDTRRLGALATDVELPVSMIDRLFCKKKQKQNRIKKNTSREREKVRTLTLYS